MPRPAARFADQSAARLQVLRISREGRSRRLDGTDKPVPHTVLCCCVIRWCVQSWVMFGRQSDFNVFYAQYQAALRHIKSGEWCVRTHAKCLLALWLS